jgi:MFS transporter, MCT family, solute carrier family 16 (monocarboxylic acid transporters), member 14
LATRSIEPSFGLLFGDLLHDLDVGTTGAAIIISMLDIMMNLSGLFVGPLLKEFSYRKVAIVGSLLCATGLALTSTATSMAHILTTYSVINGKNKNNFFLSIKLSTLHHNLTTCTKSRAISRKEICQ